jgi:hypothetical protein
MWDVVIIDSLRVAMLMHIGFCGMIVFAYMWILSHCIQFDFFELRIEHLEDV